MKEILFPKYSREQNRSCKLLDNDILEIRRLKSIGVSTIEIAEKFSVSKQTIRYWLMTEIERKQEILKRRKYKETLRPLDYFKKYRQRKKVVSPELKIYEIENAKRYKEKNLEKFKEQHKIIDKKYYQKNKDKIKKRTSKFQSEHLERHRGYNKKSRLKKITESAITSKSLDVK